MTVMDLFFSAHAPSLTASCTKAAKALLSSPVKLFRCHFNPCLLVHSSLKLCICFTTAYCFEIAAEFMAAAVAPEYNSPALFVPASLWFAARHSVLLNSAVVFSAVSCASLSLSTLLGSTLYSVMFSSVLSHPVVFYLCSALVCFYTSALLCSRFVPLYSPLSSATLLHFMRSHLLCFLLSSLLSPLSSLLSPLISSLFSTGSAPPQPLSALQTCSFIINLAVLLIRSVASTAKILCPALT